MHKKPREVMLPGFDTTEWQEWRLSYQTVTPNRTPEQVYHDRCKRKHAGFKYGKEKVKVHTVSKTPVQMKESSDKRVRHRQEKKY